MEDEEILRNAVNLQVLKFHYPTISSTVDIASHVAVYQFDIPSQQWVKTAIEGTFFLVKDQSGRIGYVILNRNSPDNLYLFIDYPQNVHLVDRYLIHKLQDRQVVGLWMFDPNDMNRIYNRISHHKF
ncbi:mRNA decapping complex regulatory subunit Dcp1 [Schizosaccharomyces octosporus yFS286]|uniref:mRNA decapping complex regulatory subunit Dcp1 n=1 Tax=Schizosaccharomyces octosporus (strain yFS286) TaxID=483514 RepID=S9QY62_SCHOY|nr:mRNA decapping complex regulatory subunit Dcp1 [Schizosaccharomyces octosporus yFS286]EPX71235.1 mRNA decapping complex regulatory subunit Dcp1 [Schizosaccharomyces octosporus yFS286]